MKDPTNVSPRVSVLKLNATARRQIAKDLGLESANKVPNQIYINRVSHADVGLKGGAVVPWILVDA